MLVAFAALVPLALIGWLVWQYAAGQHGAGSPDGAPAARPSAGGHDDGGKHGSGARPLAGRTVVLDPGHNPHNRHHAARIGRSVDIGNAKKECDTTGTSTESGYAEADFTLDLAHRVRTALRKEGASVRLTQDGDRAWGPCVDERAETGNTAHADASVSLHADGAPAGDRGFHVILPKAVHAGRADTSAITAPSGRLGRALAGAFRKGTGARPSNYLGDGHGIDRRSDLGGLNLSRVPKVFLECGNMRDPHDARHLTDAAWRKRAARGIATGIARYLAHEPAGHGAKRDGDAKRDGGGGGQ